jgi:Astacin (Peptidase family M12A)
MEELQNATCIVFKPRTTETAYISYKNDIPGCSATTGYQGQKQMVNMAPACFEDVKFQFHSSIGSFKID